MNKIKMNIWGRDFDLPVMIKQFKGKCCMELTSLCRREALPHW